MERPYAARLFIGIFFAGSVLTLTGCEEKLPTKLTIRPSAKVVFNSKGKSQNLKLAAFDEKNVPFVRKPKATFETSVPGIVNVESTDGSEAKVTPLSSGKTTITATAWGLTASVDAEVQLVGSVEFDKSTPKKFKILGDKYQLIVHVKDDKGNPIENANVYYKASDYCVKVDRKGLLFAQATGTCQVIASVNGITAKHTVEVY